MTRSATGRKKKKDDKQINKRKKGQRLNSKLRHVSGLIIAMM
ncbi:uncharacterized protein PgNI_08926 [Pyricularia grisea]|uniref:Uncharacterized protein n=1 Tax=Pyricularia grisea TaxID=148305 RepID=A0A6P8AVV6_PYRGI|nr:uncharacterized protein PgNI_08926 [Pyricularia grisea]TLD06361.1 hypothetical protein PgNI_08926 [Pyricularia grisea]